ncbi:helix-turn-helix transcriptional regulator [Nemorincola caseinilytica]|uniref:Helix-turn-helix transcriptional regulator n=1 Tax=Nemorincola caseinilytica TaxID=2054315 RepID=A0ABP8NJP6_9BACT
MKINRLKTALTEQSRTSRWLAKELGKSPSTVSRWCTNEVQPSIETLSEIARLLKIDVRELLNPTTQN